MQVAKPPFFGGEEGTVLGAVFRPQGVDDVAALVSAHADEARRFLGHAASYGMRACFGIHIGVQGVDDLALHLVVIAVLHDAARVLALEVYIYIAGALWETPGLFDDGFGIGLEHGFRLFFA